MPESKYIVVFMNGNGTTDGTRIFLNGYTATTFSKLLETITTKFYPRFGLVRQLFGAEDGSPVTNLAELKNMGKYVAARNEGYIVLKSGYMTKRERAKLGPHLRVSVSNPSELSVLLPSKGSSVLSAGNRIKVYVFANGRPTWEPVKIVLTSADLSNWDNVLNHTGSKLHIWEGIKYLYTATGQKVAGPKELSDSSCYVGVPNHSKFLQEDYLSGYEHFLERMKKLEMKYEQEEKDVIRVVRGDRLIKSAKHCRRIKKKGRRVLKRLKTKGSSAARHPKPEAGRNSSRIRESKTRKLHRGFDEL